MIDTETLILRAREHLTELPESVIFSRENLIALLPSAISAWQTETNQNKTRRQAFVIESDPVEISDGEADLTDEFDDKGFRLDFLLEGDISLLTDGKAAAFNIKFVPSRDRLALIGRQDKFFTLAYLSGTRIYLRSGTGASGELNGELLIRSVVLPADLEEFPSYIEPELATALAKLARMQFSAQNRGLDMPPKS